MSRVVNAVIVGLAAFVLVAGVAWYWAVVSQEEKVKSEVSWAMEGTEGDTTWVVADVRFSNQLDAELRLESVSVEFRVGDEVVARNDTKPDERLGGGESITVPVRFGIPSDFVVAWMREHAASHEDTRAVVEGQGTFRLGAENVVEVPIRGVREIQTGIVGSLEKWENCPSTGSAPCVAKVDAWWAEEGDLFLAARLDVRNEGSDDVELGPGKARLKLGGVEVAHGEPQALMVGPRQTSQMSVLLTVDEEALKSWWLGHLSRCEESEAVFELDAAYEVHSAEPPRPSNTTSSRPSNTTSSSPSPSPSPTSTSPSPRKNRTNEAFAFAAAAPDESGQVSWRAELEPFRTRITCGQTA